MHRPASWLLCVLLGVALPRLASGEDLTTRLQELEDRGEPWRPAPDGSTASVPAGAAATEQSSGGWYVALLVAALGAALPFAVRGATRFSASRRRNRHRERMLGKYRDDAIVDRIVSRVVWQGETAEQLLDSFGRPADVDEKVLKTKRLQVWKYEPESGGGYRLRIMVENDHVVAWEQR